MTTTEQEIAELKQRIVSNGDKIEALTHFKDRVLFWVAVGTTVAAIFGIGSVVTIQKSIQGTLETEAAKKVVEAATDQVVHLAVPKVLASNNRRLFRSIGGSDNVTPFDDSTSFSSLPLDDKTVQAYKFEDKDVPADATELLVMAQSGLDPNWGDFLRIYKIWTQEEKQEFSFRFVVKSNSMTFNQLEEQYFWLPITKDRTVFAKVLSNIAPGTPNSKSGSMSLWIAGWR